MKVFISWSGELSKAIAESIKKWLPCIIQAADVFFSPEDIEKGEQWDTKISKELLECHYGIVCLTEENVSAPWIHFEAGALAKTLDSSVATLMINISPTDIKGPLSRYQATKLNKEDFYQLIENINTQSDEPIKPEVLKTLFDNLWDKIENEFSDLISQYQKTSSSKKKAINNSEALEEILLLLRKQNSIISSPDQLLPIDYFVHLLELTNNDKNNAITKDLLFDILDYLRYVIIKTEDNEELINYVSEIEMDSFIKIISRYIDRRNRRLFFQYKDINERFYLLNKKLEKRTNDSDNNE